MPQTTLTDQIADDLRKQIDAGDLKEGTTIPSETELAAEWGASRGTVRNALRKLEESGLIISRQGRGSFVRPRRSLLRLSTTRYRRGREIKPPFMSEADAAGVSSSVSFDTAQVKAPTEVAVRLRISVGDPVSRTHYWFYADSEPIQLSTQWEPLSLTRDTPVETPEEGPVGKDGVIARFDFIGIHVTHVHESVTSRMPTPDEIRLLDIAPGTPVFFIERTHWANTTAVETADITVPTDRYRIEHTQEVPLEEQP